MSANHARNWQQFSPQQTPNKEPKAHVKVQKRIGLQREKKLFIRLLSYAL